MCSAYNYFLSITSTGNKNQSNKKHKSQLSIEPRSVRSNFSVQIFLFFLDNFDILETHVFKDTQTELQLQRAG